MREPNVIPPVDTQPYYLAHKAAIDKAIGGVLARGSFILGPEVEAFERAFSAWLGAPHVCGVANGTDAIELGLRACGVGPGHAVVTTSHTAVATVAAIERIGAVPILADIDPASACLDPTILEDLLAGKTDCSADLVRQIKAIVPVHLYGQPCDIPAFLALAERYGLAVVEDCAQAHGACIGNRKVGTFGHAAAFSFYPTKNLGALGDGGAVATLDPAIAERVRLLRQYGWRERYVSEVPGMNSRLDELQAAVLRVKLDHLDRENERRRAAASHYTAKLGDADIDVPAIRPGVEHVFHLYVIRSHARDALQARLSERGIRTLIHYPVPVHRQPAYRGRVATVGALPHTERAAAEVLSLPIGPYLAGDVIDRVIVAVREAAADLAKLGRRRPPARQQANT